MAHSISLVQLSNYKQFFNLSMHFYNIQNKYRLYINYAVAFKKGGIISGIRFQPILCVPEHSQSDGPISEPRRGVPNESGALRRLGLH